MGLNTLLMTRQGSKLILFGTQSSRSALHLDSGRSCNLNFLRWVAPMHIASWYNCQLFVFDAAASDNRDFNRCRWMFHFRLFALDKGSSPLSAFYAPTLVHGRDVRNRTYVQAHKLLVLDIPSSQMKPGLITGYDFRPKHSVGSPVSSPSIETILD